MVRGGVVGGGRRTGVIAVGGERRGRGVRRRRVVKGFTWDLGWIWIIVGLRIVWLLVEGD